ncbi:MAG: cation diffusion facilitator family transporter [Alphaproteobacteria bacterium]|nr:cation diffusion facilitator family transporter [Chthoniobacterales bacterium]MBY0463125.1 cation diffusion facilitator family transporter [Alphaproteobacteria bacterium]
MVSNLYQKAAAGQKLVLAGAIFNLVLGTVKTAAGLLGHSIVLTADGIESMLDVMTSLGTWFALGYASKPPDLDHPYGHGKAESLAAIISSLILWLLGLTIAFFSIHRLVNASHGLPPYQPKVYTLVILIVVILFKETFFQLIHRLSQKIGSTVMLADAWHHRSDMMVSLTAFIGISISLFAGSSYKNADSWAALVACGIIFYNATHIFRFSLAEIMDTRVSDQMEKTIIRLACEIQGVKSAEKCRVRKSGLVLIADLHIRVDGTMSVSEGHTISHQVKNHLLNAALSLEDITLHLEPA